MLYKLRHRGPDDSGEWSDSERGVWLGQRRLAIIDLSPLGRQPMVSASGRFVVTYNGEIFNYVELREELERDGAKFISQSDTEVLLASVERWGLVQAIERFSGMFAFALYDCHQDCLWLVRDHLGKKPLYYADRPGEIAFSSELTALWPLPWLDRGLDREALAAYFRYLCVPAPASIVRGARKVPPGAMLRWDRHGSSVVRWWKLEDIARNGVSCPITDDEEILEELESLVRTATRQRLRADVPIGVFLSGGVDSSLVAAFAQREASRPVRSFSIGFDETSHDESRHARAVAAHLGTIHEDLMLGAHEAAAMVPDVIALHDEPFADNSSVPQFLLAQFARKHVTVSLSGDGGDELFGGYPRYFWASRIERFRRALSKPGSAAASLLLRSVPKRVWDGLGTRGVGLSLAGSEGLGHRVHRFASYLGCPPEHVYRRVISAWPNPERVMSNGYSDRLGPDLTTFSSMPWAAQMMGADQICYLSDDILAKVDRTSMAVALEVRSPLLDHRIVEWSWRLPLDKKFAPTGDRGKLPIRHLLYRYVPRELIERPKMGFGMPMGNWLRGHLRSWADALLDPVSIAKLGIVNAQEVRRVWNAHLRGEDRSLQLWTVLVFLQWQHRWNAIA